MRISPKGIAFIQINEGFVAHVYNDNGHPAIGYGHDLQPGEATLYADGITQEQAEALLFRDLVPIEARLFFLVPDSCTQGQWDALCDFAYNLGLEALNTMLRHGWEFVPLQIPRWNHKLVNGVEVEDKGLTARRAAEVVMFNS
jgi:GH24 family phage-related lysozyme (muramidase)